MKKEESSTNSKCQNLQCSAIANDLEVTDEMIWKEFDLFYQCGTAVQLTVDEV